MRRIAKATTPYQTLEVWKSALETEFRCAGAVHAWHHRERFLTGLAWDMLAAGSLLGKRQPRSLLMLGLAGGTSLRILRHLLPDCHFTAVDIDGEVVELARRHMELDQLGVEVVIDDGYRWLERNRRKFDVVVDDIYLAGQWDVYRPHSPVAESLLPLLRRAMNRDAVLVLNLVIGRGHRALQSQTRARLKQEFPMVRCIRSPHALNEVLVAGDEVSALSRLRTVRFDHPGDRALWRDMSQRKL